PPRSKPAVRWGLAFAIVCCLTAMVLAAVTVCLFALADRPAEKHAQAEKLEQPAKAPDRDGPHPPPPPPPRPADKSILNAIGMRLAPIPPGKFVMGTSEEELARIAKEPLRGYSFPEAEKDGNPRHEVRITRGFYLGVYEVTQKQYRAVMGKNPSYFSKDGKEANQVKGMDTDDFPEATVN